MYEQNDVQAKRGHSLFLSAMNERGLHSVQIGQPLFKRCLVHWRSFCGVLGQKRYRKDSGAIGSMWLKLLLLLVTAFSTALVQF